eukprot:gb/GECH01011817.1/.p1 GENE.gb/GECH01011817.1/~~gb/GECH01011817.1/.p1  ORF type:complete len:509 (+),score=65.06 gb/GECH01011817.1/:1-1527(+)
MTLTTSITTTTTIIIATFLLVLMMMASASTTTIDQTKTTTTSTTTEHKENSREKTSDSAPFDPFHLKTAFEPFAPLNNDLDRHEYRDIIDAYKEKFQTYQSSYMRPQHTSSKGNSPTLKPVLIVPSLIGNQIEAQLHRDHVPKIYCSKNSDWYLLYLSHEQEVPFVVNCVFSNLALEYNNQTHQYSPADGVSTRIPYFGGVKGVRFLDGDKKKVPAWNEILNVLQDLGYTPGKNVRAATYDWRVGPTMYDNYFRRLKNLIEETSKENGNQKVAVTALSMGCPVFALFMNRYVDQEWKDQYIDSFTSLSGVYGGSSWATLSLVGGYELPGIGVDSKIMHHTFQTMGSISWLLPYHSVFGDKSIVSTPSRNYSATTKDTLQLLRNSKSGLAAEILSGMDHFRFPFQPLGVPTSCVMGYNISTPASLTYTSSPPNFQKPQVHKEDGDGTVLTPSLEVCAGWKNRQSQPVDVVRVPNMVHGGALVHPEAIRTLVDNLLPVKTNDQINDGNSS